MWTGGASATLWSRSRPSGVDLSVSETTTPVQVERVSNTSEVRRLGSDHWDGTVPELSHTRTSPPTTPRKPCGTTPVPGPLFHPPIFTVSCFGRCDRGPRVLPHPSTREDRDRSGYYEGPTRSGDTPDSRRNRALHHPGLPSRACPRSRRRRPWTYTKVRTPWGSPPPCHPGPDLPSWDDLRSHIKGRVPRVGPTVLVPRDLPPFSS